MARAHAAIPYIAFAAILLAVIAGLALTNPAPFLSGVPGLSNFTSGISQFAANLPAIAGQQKQSDVERVNCINEAMKKESCYAKNQFDGNKTFVWNRERVNCSCPAGTPEPIAVLTNEEPGASVFPTQDGNGGIDGGNSPIPDATLGLPGQLSPTATSILLPSSTPAASVFPTPVSSPIPAASLAGNLTWLYVLTGYDKPGALEKITAAPSGFLVVDSFKSSPESPFTQAEVSALKAKHGTVLAYISIGEAERYRPYWQEEWDSNRPAWMGRDNPVWGSPKVKYWDPAWQQIVFESLGRITAQGFDGAYLDIVDAYEYWSDPLNGEDEVVAKDEAAASMIAFMSEIRKRARQNNSAFLVFPQNAPELVGYPGYLDAMDGIGKESTWHEGYNELSDAASRSSPIAGAETAEVVGYLKQIRQAGKTVLVVDYFAPSQQKEAAKFAEAARANGFIPYASDARALDRVSSFFSVDAASGSAGLSGARSDGATRVTGGHGSDQNPAFLDDNTLVFTRFSAGYNAGPAALMGAYLGNLTEFVIWEDGAQNVNVNGNPFTPDRKQLCYSSDIEDTDEVWCINLATRQRTRVTANGRGLRFFEPSVSADSKRIVFEAHDATPAETPGRLWVSDFSGALSPLLADSSDNRLPMFNPYNGKVLFQRNSGSGWRLFVREENGALKELGIPTEEGTDASWASASQIVYSADGKDLLTGAYLAYPKIYSYDVATERGRQETSAGFEDGAPAVSPNGRLLAFESHAAQGADSPASIWVVARK